MGIYPNRNMVYIGTGAVFKCLQWWSEQIPGVICEKDADPNSLIITYADEKGVSTREKIQNVVASHTYKEVEDAPVISARYTLVLTGENEGRELRAFRVCFPKDASFSKVELCMSRASVQHK